MAIEKRKALLHILFTFDCDTDGPDRLKTGAVAIYAVGLWDTEREDPRKRDGVNAPIDLGPQMGFWAKDTQPQTITEGITLENEALPETLLKQIDGAAVQAVGSLQTANAALIEANASLARRAEDLQGKVTEREGMIAALQQQIVEREGRAASIEDRVAALEAATVAKVA